MLIYCLRNECNGKCYVGQHGGWKLSDRWPPGLSKPTNSHLGAAIRMYGPKAFTRRVLAYASCQTEADLLERFFIAALQTTNQKFGYNLQFGGMRGANRHTQGVRERIASSVHKAWLKKSPKEKARLRRLQRLLWQTKSEAEQTERNGKVSRAMRLCWSQRPRTERKRIAGKIRATLTGRESVQKRYYKLREVGMTAKVAKIKVQLQEEVTDIIDSAIRALEAGQSTALFRSQLREVSRKLTMLEQEYKGGCSW